MSQEKTTDQPAPEVLDTESTDGDSESTGKSGIQSVDIGLRVLRVLVDAPGPMTLKEIGIASGMEPSKVHRYMRSLVNGGLAFQQKKSGRYDLGPYAAHMGLQALNRIDVVNRVAEHIESLAQELSALACISVWSHMGPIIIRSYQATPDYLSYYPIGSVLPVLASATGNAFLAYLPREITAKRVGIEMSCMNPPPSEAEIAARTQSIRDHGYSWVQGTFVAHRAGVAVPILGPTGELRAVVTAVTMAIAKPELDQNLIVRLKSFCEEFSLDSRSMHHQEQVRAQARKLSAD